MHYLIIEDEWGSGSDMRLTALLC